MFERELRKSVLLYSVVVLLYVPLFGLTTTTNYYTNTAGSPFDVNRQFSRNYNSNYNQSFHSSAHTQSINNSRKPNEYTKFYLDNQTTNRLNNLYNYIANYRAYLHHRYHDTKFPKIKGYNYVKRKTIDLDSLESNFTLPSPLYSLNFDDQSHSNLITILLVAVRR